MTSPFDARSIGSELSQGWSQLHRFANAGIPYAQDILQSLNRYELTYPCLATPHQAFDIRFYLTVHLAHRKRRLDLFLDFLTIAKDTQYWHTVRDDHETQVVVIDVFLKKGDSRSVLDAVNLMPTWCSEIIATSQPKAA